jgi:hypothetical protein
MRALYNRMLISEAAVSGGTPSRLISAITSGNPIGKVTTGAGTTPNERSAST